MAGAARKRAEENWTPTKPATSREGRQAKLENLALDLIESRLRDGTASSQETTLYAKSASTRGQIEEMRIRHEIELMKAKKQQIESQEQLQQMFQDAILAMNHTRIEVDEYGTDVPGGM